MFKIIDSITIPYLELCPYYNQDLSAKIQEANLLNTFDYILSSILLEILHWGKIKLVLRKDDICKKYFIILYYFFNIAASTFEMVDESFVNFIDDNILSF